MFVKSSLIKLIDMTIIHYPIMTIKISSMPSFPTKFEHQKRALLNEHSLNYLSIIFVLSTVSISLFLFVAFFATINNVESTAKAK